MIRHLFLSIAGLIATVQGALAQTSTPIDRGRVDREQPAVPRTQPDRPRAPAAAVRIDTSDAVAAPIRTIRFEGTAVPAVVANAALAYVGRPADRATLQALTDAMSAAYARSEVALFTIVVPEQDLSTGALVVMVGEGHIEAVVLTGEVEGRPLRLVRSLANRLTRERPTSRRTLERYLSLIQDIPGLTVQSQLELGTGQGGVRLILALDHRRPSLAFGFDNRTTRLVRDGQFNAVARGYGLLREGDETRIDASASANFSDQFYLGLTHSTPIGREGTRLALNAGYLETRPAGTVLRGRARSLSATLTHPLIRSYRRNMTLSLGLDGIDSDDAAFGSTIATERVRAVRGAIGYAQAGRRRTITGGLTLSRGLDWLGAEVAAVIGNATFLKVNGRATVDQAIGRRAVLRLRASGQWTRDPLPAIERFAVGGPDFGRAFETGLINADRGAAVLAELAWRPVGNGAFSSSEVYGFGDYAAVRFLPRPGFTGQDVDLASAGGGVRLAWRERVQLELEYAHVVDRPFPDYDNNWRVSVGWRVSLRP